MTRSPPRYWFSPGEWRERPVNYAQGARATTKMNQHPFRSRLAPLFGDSYIPVSRIDGKMSTETAISPQPTIDNAQMRISGALDRAAELQHAGQLDEAARELEAAFKIARGTPYEIEFMTRIRLGMTLADLYLGLDRIQEARQLANEEAAFADKINQIMQATGKPAQKRMAMAGYLQVRDRGKQLTLLGEPAPEISVNKWLSGGVASLSETLGRVALLEFWATWCKPCAEMFPKLNLLHAEHSPRGLDIIALTRHYLAYRGADKAKAEELELMRKMITDHSVKFHVGVAEDELLQTTYGANGLPTVILIDRRGIVRYAGAGGEEPMFVRALDKYLSTTE
jgi:thiol-disulfide isomerase/thioredoxin